MIVWWWLSSEYIQGAAPSMQKNKGGRVVHVAKEVVMGGKHHVVCEKSFPSPPLLILSPPPYYLTPLPTPISVSIERWLKRINSPPKNKNHDKTHWNCLGRWKYRAPFVVVHIHLKIWIFMCVYQMVDDYYLAYRLQYERSQQSLVSSHKKSTTTPYSSSTSSGFRNATNVKSTLSAFPRPPSPHPPRCLFSPFPLSHLAVLFAPNGLLPAHHNMHWWIK